MKALDEFYKKYQSQLSSLYSEKEIEIIFFTLAELYLHKDKTILKLGLHELNEETYQKSLLFENSLYLLTTGMPYQYVTGIAYFYGEEFIVNKHILIPRPETEELIEWILADCKKRGNLQIIDLCTGSGCIPIILKKHLPQAKISAIDYNDDVLEVARKNAKIHRKEIDFSRMDLLADFEINIPKKFDVIVSNPPYIKESEKKEMNASVVDFEPQKALFVSDSNPLIFYERIILFAEKYLAPDGKIYVEINQNLGYETQELFQKHFKNVELRKDISENFRMIKASNS